jgi:hypothetical protein
MSRKSTSAEIRPATAITAEKSRATISPTSTTLHHFRNTIGQKPTMNNRPAAPTSPHRETTPSGSDPVATCNHLRGGVSGEKDIAPTPATPIAGDTPYAPIRPPYAVDVIPFHTPTCITYLPYLSVHRRGSFSRNLGGLVADSGGKWCLCGHPNPNTHLHAHRASRCTITPVSVHMIESHAYANANDGWCTSIPLYASGSDHAASMHDDGCSCKPRLGCTPHHTHLTDCGAAPRCGMPLRGIFAKLHVGRPLHRDTALLYTTPSPAKLHVALLYSTGIPSKLHVGRRIRHPHLRFRMQPPTPANKPFRRPEAPQPARDTLSLTKQPEYTSKRNARAFLTEEAEWRLAA